MRRVVQHPSPRCEHCQLPLRWCVCAAQAVTESALAVAVLMQNRERFRPSSTGQLIRRVMPASTQHLWRRDQRPTMTEVCVPGRELWILHPQGEPPPEGARAAEVQVLLLDGSWREASALAQEVAAWGRRVSLPMHGESRYWLRTQPDAGRFSTVEALLYLLRHLGQEAAAETLNLQFELHVYANLRARGQKEQALAYLERSPIKDVFGALLAELDVKRPR